VLGYTQSDEISLVLVDYKNINTEPWFGNNLQKIVSISASMATFFFRQNFEEAIKDEYFDWYTTGTVNDEKEKLLNQHTQAYSNKLCVFDARAFIIPREEVANYIYWRQLDCVRNSIQLAGQAYFSQKQLQNKNCDQIQEMLWQEHRVNWSKYPTWFKNGVAIYKQPREIYHKNEDGTQSSVVRDKFTIDLEMPMVSQNPDFINKLVIFKE
jgi:tRNA(His) 5'-end guanylyltransferase